MGLIHEKTEAKILMLLSLSNPLNGKKHLAVKKNLISSYPTAKNMPKIAKVKLSSCGPEVADFRTKCDCGLPSCGCGSTGLFKSCGIATAEVLPSSCGVTIAD
jgi:hypothetical protein